METMSLFMEISLLLNCPEVHLFQEEAEMILSFISKLFFLLPVHYKLQEGPHPTSSIQIENQPREKGNTGALTHFKMHLLQLRLHRKVIIASLWGNKPKPEFSYLNSL